MSLNAAYAMQREALRQEERINNEIDMWTSRYGELDVAIKNNVPPSSVQIAALEIFLKKNKDGAKDLLKMCWEWYENTSIKLNKSQSVAKAKLSRLYRIYACNITYLKTGKLYNYDRLRKNDRTLPFYRKY